MDIFEDQNLQNIYESILDEKISAYNEDLEEISTLEGKFEENPDLLQGMLNYVKKINFLDTEESSVYKKADSEKIPSAVFDQERR